MPNERPDFITVRLSDAALKEYGEDVQVRAINAHYHYVFIGRTPVEIQRRGEWPALRHPPLANGAPMFQEAEASADTDSTSSEA